MQTVHLKGKGTSVKLFILILHWFFYQFFTFIFICRDSGLLTETSKMKLSQKLLLIFLRVKFRLLSALSKKAAARAAFDLFCTPQQRNTKPLSGIFKQAESLVFELNGVTIRGFRWNHPADRKVLLLHGFSSSIGNFGHFVTPLLQKGYEVLAFDAPAHGRSDGRQITAPLYRDMILAIHEKYGPVHSFIAHSFGGLALSLALEKMEQADSMKAVLIAPASETVTALSQLYALLAIRSEPVKAEVENVIEQTGGYPLSWYAISRVLPAVHTRILWIHDDQDNITPLQDAMKVKEKNYPHLQFVITHGLGHRRIYRDSKVVSTIMDFL